MGSYAVAGGLPDEDLVRRCRSGQEDAFTDIYARYHSRVMATVYRILRDRAEAQDVTQEVFLKFYRSLEAWDPNRAQLSSWLFRMSENRAIDSWRARRRHLNPAGPELPSEPSATAEPAACPHRRLECIEKTRHLERGIEALPELQRRLFVLRYVHQLKMDEIAALEKRSIGTVKSALHRATRSIRRRLAHYC